MQYVVIEKVCCFAVKQEEMAAYTCHTLYMYFNYLCYKLTVFIFAHQVAALLLRVRVLVGD